MRRGLALALTLAVLAGCLGGPPPGPAWRVRAAEATQRYYDAILTGETQRANSNLRQALEAASRSDDLTSLARVHLGRAAMQVALLREPDLERADELIALARDPDLGPYRRFLAGEPKRADADRLPGGLADAARHLAAGRPGRLAQAVAAIDQPRRRLVAAAVAHRRHPRHRAFASAAVDAASGEGWRGALLTWLPVQAEAAEREGETARAATIRDRLRWLRDPLSGQPGSGG